MDTPTARANEALVRAFYADVDAGRADAAFARLAPDVAFELIAPPPLGGVYDREGLSRFFAEVMAPAMAGPFRVSVTGITAEGERVAVETVSECVNAAGMRYNNRYHSLFIIRDGRIVALREYLDSAHLLQFLGRAAQVRDRIVRPEPLDVARDERRAIDRP